ncbi:MAG: response regulator [Planctomycetes bacterium]|nr:response regulator [Planctomycetota bacterium]
MIGEAVRRLLAPFPDIEFTATQDADAGYALALSRRPDVILQDLMMPGVDGMEQIVRIHERAHNARAIQPAQVGDQILLLLRRPIRRPPHPSAHMMMKCNMARPRTHGRELSLQNARRLAVLDVLHLLASANHRPHHLVRVEHIFDARVCRYQPPDFLMLTEIFSRLRTRANHVSIATCVPRTLAPACCSRAVSKPISGFYFRMV